MIKINTCHIIKDEPYFTDGTESKDILELGNDFNGIELEPVSDISYNLVANMAGQDLIVTGQAEFTLKCECSRCLDTIQRLIKTQNMCLLFEKCPDQEVDITEDIREELLLQIPTKILCREDCKGICQGCGADLNKEKCTCPDKDSSDGNDDSGNSPWSALDNLSKLS